MKDKIIIADDSSTMLRIVENVCIQIGVPKEHLIKAEDGVKALKAYNDNKDNIKAVLTDWNMPNMNGLELVKKIREMDKKVPIVMITTEGGKMEVVTALKAGVNNYIVKPFSAETLKDKLTALKVNL